MWALPCTLALLASVQLLGQAQGKFEIDQDLLDQSMNYEANHRGIDDGSNMNSWSQFEIGFSEGLLKFYTTSYDLGSEQKQLGCYSEGMELLNAWIRIVVRWIKQELGKGESDKELEDLANIVNLERGEDSREIMTTTAFATLSIQLLYKCNYMATLEGLVLNKMLVDTVYMAPDELPYWVKNVLFFLITTPMLLFTGFDDLLGGLLLYTRLQAHLDFYDLGIVAGKLVRILFQLVYGTQMLWDRMLQYISFN
eukprot:CAMPEP_0168613586 /NCGR_PEP_ID=MMETSP0449_2-20121227/3528_1 /TAXON_ID=1082188 /ORGANISM="Strombidium rassoulzadegani, Strain ras09" /LENGTH=252 /DNA_ID=CAMNT_0008654225 /DNA_START=16 /DNA_END=774 /DNA_ORIENTATION=+